MRARVSPSWKRRSRGSGYGIGLENGSAYLFNLTFPFSDKSKVKLVIANELEERVPVAMDDMVVDFVKSGQGRRLAGARQSPRYMGTGRTGTSGSPPFKVLLSFMPYGGSIG